MLAAETAWRILRAEHARMGQLLESLDGSFASDGWRRPGPQLDALRALIRRLQEFDDITHRPKGVVLLSTLRGRSPDADALLDTLARERRQCDELLDRAGLLLEAIAAGRADAADELRSVLGQHRRLLLRHMEREDTLLHSQSARLLSPAEWSAIVSSISAVVEAAAPRARRRAR